MRPRFRPIPEASLGLPPPEAHQAFISEAPAQQGMSLTQVITMVRARWKWILIISLTLIVFGAVLIKLLPKTYTATATLIVDSDVKDPLAGRDFRVEAVANYVSTQMELIASPIILVPVIERLGLTEDKAFTAGFAGSPEALRESVQKNLLTALTVERGTGGQLIYINVSNKNAARAAQIANAIADVFLEQDRIRRNGPARERAQRYTEELAELREKAIVAQDKVTEFRKAHGLDDLNQGSADSEVQALDTLHARLLETQNMRRSLESKAASAKAANTASGSPQTLREQLQNELSQLDQLKGVYGPQHPRIRELEAQIAATRASLGDEERSLSGTRELERKYQAAIAEQEAKVLNLREAQDEGGKLLLELESAKSVYKQALDGFDQILFQSVANQTNVSIVSHAVAPLRASKPNKMKLMLMVLAAGLGLGVCGPLGYELLFDRRLRCRDDMEREFGIPVIAQLEPVAALRHA